MSNFDKKQEDTFVSIIHRSLIEGDKKAFLSTLITEEEMACYDLPSSVIKTINKHRKKSGDFYDELYAFICNNTIDFATSEVFNIEVKVVEAFGVLGTEYFKIIFKTLKGVYIALTMRQVISVGGRLVWSETGTFQIVEEPRKDNTAKNKMQTASLYGTYKDKHIKTSQYPTLPYLKHADKQARVYEYLEIEGDLDLDGLFGEGIKTIVVEGYLDVKGNIINRNANCGTSLFVKGSAKALNLIAGGAIISLTEAIIDDFAIAYYNDGIFSAASLQADIFINYDHHVEIRDTSKIEISIDYDDEIEGRTAINDIEALTAYLEQKNEQVVTKEEYDNIQHLNIDAVMERIVTNRYVSLKQSIESFTRDTKHFK